MNRRREKGGSFLFERSKFLPSPFSCFPLRLDRGVTVIATTRGRMDRLGRSMTITQEEKATRFHSLHEGQGTFVIPNPWDIASSKLLAGLGFQALATSSAAAACAIGKKDGGLTRDQALEHARMIVS